MLLLWNWNTQGQQQLSLEGLDHVWWQFLWIKSSQTRDCLSGFHSHTCKREQQPSTEFQDEEQTSLLRLSHFPLKLTFYGINKLPNKVWGSVWWRAPGPSFCHLHILWGGSLLVLGHRGIKRLIKHQGNSSRVWIKRVITHMARVSPTLSVTQSSKT